MMARFSDFQRRLHNWRYACQSFWFTTKMVNGVAKKCKIHQFNLRSSREDKYIRDHERFKYGSITHL